MMLLLLIISLNSHKNSIYDFLLCQAIEVLAQLLQHNLALDTNKKRKF